MVASSFCNGRKSAFKHYLRFDRRIKCRVLTVRFSHWYFLEIRQLIKINLITLKNTNTWTKLLQKRLWSDLEIMHIKNCNKCWQSAHLKNFKVQYLNHQASDHPGFCTFFHSSFQTFSGCSICFQNCITSNMTKGGSHEQNTSKSLYGWLLTAFSE